MQRIGVFVCHCGTNIAGTVDVKAVASALKNEPGVVFSTDYQYMCSQAGQDMIKAAVAENKLTGIVVCSCSPRMHEATFRKTAAAAGLNPYMVEIANIREQCSWVHKEMPIGTEKAIILAKAAVAKVNLNAPLTPGESPVTKRALVIGGGIAGIQTALDIADAGFPVDIVEKKPTIGGKMAQLDKTFPTLDCAACILTPKMVDVAQNENIRIFSREDVGVLTGEEIEVIDRVAEEYNSKIRYQCTGCGYCLPCPQKIDIPYLIDKLNNWFAFDKNPSTRLEYRNWTDKHGSDCIHCGQCEEKCPQGLKISDIMREAEAELE